MSRLKTENQNKALTQYATLFPKWFKFKIEFKPCFRIILEAGLGPSKLIILQINLFNRCILSMLVFGRQSLSKTLS